MRRETAFIAVVSLVLSTGAPLSARPEWLEALRWRSIGPAHMSGRVTDIAVPKGQTGIVYCATATGGVWKTVNRGTTWAPIFDQAGTSSTGAIAVADSDPDLVWVGTGEANASSYASWGDGVYKSTDGGSTWTHMGLPDSHHIGRIVIDPRDPDVVYVAAAGHLWGPNPERGLYKTSDGGKTWIQSHFISEDVGFVDLAMDPSDPNTLYAAAWARRSDRFDDFDSMGIYALEGGGLYKTTDGGETWSPLTEGLPTRRIGRIGLAIAPTDPRVVYALVEVAPVWISLGEEDLDLLKRLLQGRGPPESAERARLREAVLRAAPDGNVAPVFIRKLSRREQAQFRVLLGFEELDTGGGVFRSSDGGKTWKRVNALNEREPYYSQIRVDPTDENHLYVLLVRTWESADGGRTFEQTDWAISSWLTSSFIHGDFHAMWIDPENPRHLIVGSDGGLYSSFDAGAHWEAHPMPLGQFVGIAVDSRKPYYVYGGLQDNGTWGGPSATRHRSGIADSDWFKVQTADGGYPQVDPTAPERIYVQSQYANLERVDLATGARVSLRPRSGPDEPAPRFNFNAPLLLSPHDPSTLYLGAQKLLRSRDRGETWTALGPDLSKDRPSPDTGEGATITAIAQSPRDPAVLWAGTDDGNLQVTRNAGASWSNVADRLPGAPRDEEGRCRAWVSSIEASSFNPATAYVALDDHRNDDFGVYLYRTRNFGESWEPIRGNLLEGAPVRVVREDRENPHLLFAGTETGAYASLDGGGKWLPLRNGLPTVPVRDMVIHPRHSDLVIGTHGRSIYILDIAPLQQMTAEVRESEAYFFAIEPATLFQIDLTKNKGASGARRFSAPNPYSELIAENDRSGLAPPGATFYYYLRQPGDAPAELEIYDPGGELVGELEGPARAGLNRVAWDLRKSPGPPPPEWQQVGGNDSRRLAARGATRRLGPLVEPGRYTVKLRVGRRELDRELRVEPDR